jgi:hypothetical protein
LSVVAIIDEVENIAKSITPVENAASRFGNPAFRTFYDTVKQVRHISPFRSMPKLKNDLRGLLSWYPPCLICRPPLWKKSPAIL